VGLLCAALCRCLFLFSYVCFVYSYSLSVGALHVAPIFCHLPPPSLLYVSVVVVVVVIVIILFYFVLFLSYLTLSLLFWKGDREVLFVVL
jgi:hypothetical protein